MSLSIIIPAKNEAATIGKVCEAISGLCPEAELIVVDESRQRCGSQGRRASGEWRDAGVPRC